MTERRRRGARLKSNKFAPYRFREFRAKKTHWWESWRRRKSRRFWTSSKPCLCKHKLIFSSFKSEMGSNGRAAFFFDVAWCWRTWTNFSGSLAPNFTAISDRIFLQPQNRNVQARIHRKSMRICCLVRQEFPSASVSSLFFLDKLGKNTRTWKDYQNVERLPERGKACRWGLNFIFSVGKKGGGVILWQDLRWSGVFRGGLNQAEKFKGSRADCSRLIRWEWGRNYKTPLGHKWVLGRQTIRGPWHTVHTLAATVPKI